MGIPQEWRGWENGIVLCKQFAGHPSHLTSRSHLQIYPRCISALQTWMAGDGCCWICTGWLATRLFRPDFLQENVEKLCFNALRSTLLRRCSSCRPEPHVKHWMFSNVILVQFSSSNSGWFTAILELHCLIWNANLRRVSKPTIKGTPPSTSQDAHSLARCCFFRFLSIHLRWSLQLASKRRHLGWVSDGQNSGSDAAW